MKSRQYSPLILFVSFQIYIAVFLLILCCENPISFCSAIHRASGDKRTYRVDIIIHSICFPMKNSSSSFETLKNRDQLTLLEFYSPLSQALIRLRLLRNWDLMSSLNLAWEHQSSHENMQRVLYQIPIPKSLSVHKITWPSTEHNMQNNFSIFSQFPVITKWNNNLFYYFHHDLQKLVKSNYIKSNSLNESAFLWTYAKEMGVDLYEDHNDGTVCIEFVESLPSNRYNRCSQLCNQDQWKGSSNDVLHRTKRGTSACDPNPCQNNKNCLLLSTGTGYSCSCSTPLTISQAKIIQTGWSGTNCDVDINECDSSPCENDGLCSNTFGGFFCSCGQGVNGYFYTGDYCQDLVDQCASPKPSLNLNSLPLCKNGNCTTTAVDPFFQCTCNPGWKGMLCDTDIDECAPSPCFNNATCINLVNAYQCQCISGFNGTRCENNINDCYTGACANGGVCIDAVNSYTCNCTNTGYSGSTCQEDIDECVIYKPCLNGGNCTNIIGSYSCSCYSAYTGVNCQVDINECINNPCGSFGTCLQLSNKTLYDMKYNDLAPFKYGVLDYSKAAGYLCDCSRGRIGKQCEFLDPCLYDGNTLTSSNSTGLLKNPCYNNSTCLSFLDNTASPNYTCQCVAPWSGRNCSAMTVSNASLSTAVIIGVCISILGIMLIGVVGGYVFYRIRLRRENQNRLGFSMDKIFNSSKLPSHPVFQMNPPPEKVI